MLDMVDRLKLDGMFLGCTVPLSPGPLRLLILPVPNISLLQSEAKVFGYASSSTLDPCESVSRSFELA